jgi:hypothetical protein
MQVKIYASLLLSLIFACAACSSSASLTQNQNQSNVPANGELHFKAPDAWTTEKPTSAMRVAQYKLPKADGDPEDGSLVLYYFGAGQGGNVQANIDRWINQMQQSDGSASKDKAKTGDLTVNGLKVSTVDVSGTYTAEMSPGSGDHHNNANYRLRAAVIETPKGNYFAKLVGPTNTVAKWDQAFNDYLKSFEFK